MDEEGVKACAMEKDYCAMEVDCVAYEESPVGQRDVASLVAVCRSFNSMALATCLLGDVDLGCCCLFGSRPQYCLMVCRLLLATNDIMLHKLL